MDYYFTISKLITPLVLISNFFILTLIIFFYLGIYKNQKIFKNFFILIFLTFILFSVFPVGKILNYYFLEKDYFEKKIPKNIDFIFVPSGSTERLISAIDVKNKYELENVKILYSSGNPYLDKKNYLDEEKLLMITIIENSKINQSDIIFLPEARNTFENIKRLNEYLIKKNKPNSKILLISQASHLKRCLMISKKYKLNTFGYASSYSSKNFAKGFVNGYQKTSVANNLGYVDRFFKETLSLIYVKFFFTNDH